MGQLVGMLWCYVVWVIGIEYQVQCIGVGGYGCVDIFFMGQVIDFDVGMKVYGDCFMGENFYWFGC